MENGMLCENNAEAWYGAISALVDDRELLEKLRERCLKEVAEIYSIEAVSEKYYESICRCDLTETGARVRNLAFKMLGYKIRHFIGRCWNYLRRKMRMHSV